MSIKSQEANMRKLAGLLSQNLSYVRGERESGPNGAKRTFLNLGKVFLRALAKDLGLRDVRVMSNPGGIAVSGQCCLYGMWVDSGLFISIVSPVNLLLRDLPRLGTARGNDRNDMGLFQKPGAVQVVEGDIIHPLWVVKHSARMELQGITTDLPWGLSCVVVCGKPFCERIQKLMLSIAPDKSFR